MSYRISAAAAILIAGLLSGCQTLTANGLYYDRTQELPAFFRNHHKLYESSGHEFRGYDLGNRHYF